MVIVAIVAFDCVTCIVRFVWGVGASRNCCAVDFDRDRSCAMLASCWMVDCCVKRCFGLRSRGVVAWGGVGVVAPRKKYVQCVLHDNTNVLRTIATSFPNPPILE